MLLTNEEVKALYDQLIDLAYRVGRLEGRQQMCKECIDRTIAGLQSPDQIK